MSEIIFGNNKIIINDIKLLTHVYLFLNNCTKSIELKINEKIYLEWNINFSPIVTYLEFISQFKNPINLLKYSNLKIFRCGYYFDLPIDGILPDSLEELYLPGIFSYTVDNLPQKLKILDFDSNSKFNHPVDNLPNSLKKLILGNNFNCPIDNLPNGIEKIKFNCSGDMYKFQLNNLPNSLKEIYLPKRYRYHIDNLPDSIEIIYAYKYFMPIKKIPQNAKQISVGYNSKIYVEECCKKQNIILVELGIFG